MPDIAKIAEDLSGLSVLEIADLVKTLEEKWGVSAAAPVAVAAVASSDGGEGGAPKEEQSEFNVVLTGAGANKIAVIKEIRAVVPGLGLAEAKKMADTPPAVLKEAASKEEAEEIKKKLEAAGATVELK